MIHGVELSKTLWRKDYVMTAINRREFLDSSQKAGLGLAAGLTILGNRRFRPGNAGQR